MPAALPNQPCLPPAPEDRPLIGENGRDLRYIFVSPPKYVVGTTVPDPVYFQLLDHPGGISAFYEEALMKFSGSMEELLNAAVHFSAERKLSRQTNAIRSANGRISKAAHDRLLAIEGNLKGIRGISKAKLLAGLIQLFLQETD